MRAAGIRAFGGVERIEMLEVPIPVPGRGEVLIRLHAASVGPWDTKTRQGMWDVGLPFPLVLGVDGAGVVEALGPGADKFAVGARVYAYAFPMKHSGTYAPYAAVPQSHMAHMPMSVDFAHAAAIPVSGSTAHESLTSDLKIKSGETVLITGAAGGTGTFAVQIARHIGAHVIGTASPTSVDYLRTLGADEVIDYTAGDIVEQLRAMHPDGVDAVLDCVGGATGKRSVAAVKKRGRIASLLGKPKVGRRRGLTAIEVNAQSSTKRLKTLADMVDSGALKVRLEAVLPLECAADAHRRIESGHVHGKIVLDTSSRP